jgi:hypothetical protein
MNKLKLSLVLALFCGAALAQNDTTHVNPPKSDSSAVTKEPEPAPAPPPAPTPTTTPGKKGKRPKSYDDYINKGKRPTEVSPLSDNIYYGCNLQLGFYQRGAANVVYYDISPHAGYKFNEVLSAGIQVIYNNQAYSYAGQRINYNIFGVGAFGRALFLDRFFLQVEIDALSVPAAYRGTVITRRVSTEEKMAGIGYKSPLSDKLSYFFVLMYNIQPGFYSPYNILVYRAGLSWNF